jgi:predicted ATP-grasp superfamily ATP-dependent carboligase
MNGINGMGLYGELLDPRIPQYRAAKSIIETLEKLTYQKLGNLSELDIRAEAVETQLKGNINDDDY